MLENYKYFVKNLQMMVIMKKLVMLKHFINKWFNFINNPTYESLANAKHIRDVLERATVINLIFKILLEIII